MNTKHFPAFSFFIFILISILVSCSSEDPFVVCKVSEYDCDYQQLTAGILTVTKGSHRRHYILTEKGMRRAEINEGEPVGFNPETGIAVIKEVTDSSIDVFTIDTRSGKETSSAISLKPKMKGKDGKPFFALPTLLSSCVMNDGTVVLLVNYDKPQFSGPEAAAESYDFLYVFEKGDPEKFKKYAFPYDEGSDDETDEEPEYFWDEPRNIQCIGEEIYLFSERSYAGGGFFFHNPQQNWILSRIKTAPQKEEPDMTPLAIVAYDNVVFNFYSVEENAVYSILHYSEEMEALRKLHLTDGYELPDEPLEKENGNFLLSAAPDGRMLVFFLQTRASIEEEQRIEPLFK